MESLNKLPPDENIPLIPKEYNQTDLTILKDLQKDLSAASPKEKMDLMVRGLAEIQDRLAMLSTASYPIKISTEIEMISRELEKIGPTVINDCLKELNKIKTSYTPLILHSGKAEIKKELGDKQIILGDSLVTAYKLFSEIRKTISNYKTNTSWEKDALIKAHSHLSKAMIQSNSSPSDSVEFPVLKQSKLSAASLILKDSYGRNKIGEAVGIWIKGVASVAKNVFRRHVMHDKTTEKPSEIMNKTKALMTNSIAALSTFVAGVAFGKDLKAASRNVVTAIDIKSDKDIKNTKKLLDEIKKVQDDAKELITGKPMTDIPLGKVTHINDGVCAGLSLELSLEVLRNKNLAHNYLHFSENIATRGAPPNAHANQACYQAIESKGMSITSLEEIMTDHQAHALDVEKGEGIYKANFGNVSNCYNALLNPNTDNDFNQSPLGKAVQKVKQEHGELLKQTKDEFPENYITNTKQFKEEVLKVLAQDPEGGQTAENELEWLMGNLELRFVFNYCRAAILEPFETGTDGDLNNVRVERSIESILSFVSNPEIRKNLDYMMNLEDDFYKYQTVARARGASLERVSTIGYSYGAKSDNEILDRMNDLEDGCYILSIELKEGAHAMQFYKKGDEQYLFDPNFGVIDCSHGRHKEQITKLLLGLEAIYPPPKNQGPNSEGKSHNITLLKVVDADSHKYPDLLASPQPPQVIRT